MERLYLISCSLMRALLPHKQSSLVFISMQGRVAYSPPYFLSLVSSGQMKTFIVCLIFAIGLISCSPISSSSAYPNDPAYPNPGQGSPFPGVIPTPIASKGTVIGTLVSNTTGKSIAGLMLYFGTLLPLTPGPEHLVSMDIVNSPKTTISDDGSFVAENIAPGKYVLILWTPHESSYVPDSNNAKKDLIVEVAGGQIVDLGTLQVTPP
jgi:hypothetical protein